MVDKIAAGAAASPVSPGAAPFQKPLPAPRPGRPPGASPAAPAPRSAEPAADTPAPGPTAPGRAKPPSVAPPASVTPSSAPPVRGAATSRPVTGAARAVAGGQPPAVRAGGARLLSEVQRAQGRLDQILRMAESGRTFSPAELLAFQAHAYRASQELDLAGKVVEKGTGGVKQVLQTQI